MVEWDFLYALCRHSENVYATIVEDDESNFFIIRTDNVTIICTDDTLTINSDTIDGAFRWELDGHKLTVNGVDYQL